MKQPKTSNSYKSIQERVEEKIALLYRSQNQIKNPQKNLRVKIQKDGPALLRWNKVMTIPRG